MKLFVGYSGGLFLKYVSNKSIQNNIGFRFMTMHM